MRYLIYSLLIGLAAANLTGQNIEEEPFYDIVTPDHITGNDKVPEVYTTCTSFDRFMVARLKHKTDLLDGLEQIAGKEKIKNAVIITGIGSVTDYHIHVVDNKTFPSKNAFIKGDTPMDVTNITGYIIDGRVHAHLTLSDENLAIGGHLEPGTTVFTFCVITIGILSDSTSLKRFDDKSLR
jgi:predicted DNA-binding protein with PD1-like motif